MAEPKLNSSFLTILSPPSQNLILIPPNYLGVTTTPSNIHSSDRTGGTKTGLTWDLLKELRNMKQQTDK